MKVIGPIIVAAVAGWRTQFVWPWSPSKGNTWLTQTALSHAAGRVADSFLPTSQHSTRHAIQTHRWRQEGIYTPPVNIPSRRPGLWCLVGLKANSEQETAEMSYQLLHRSSFTLRALEDCGVVRLKANNVPTAHVHILSGSAAFPQPLAIFQSGKGLGYTRAADHCVLGSWSNGSTVIMAASVSSLRSGLIWGYSNASADFTNENKHRETTMHFEEAYKLHHLSNYLVYDRWLDKRKPIHKFTEEQSP